MSDRPMANAGSLMEGLKVRWEHSGSSVQEYIGVARPTRSSSAAPSCQDSPSAWIQGQQILCQADQGPFRVHLRQPAQEKLPEAPGAFDQPEDRLDDRLASSIEPAAPLCRQPPLHPLPDSQPRRGTASGRVGQAFAVPLLARGDQGLTAHGLQRGDVGVAAIPGIGQEHAGRRSTGAYDLSMTGTACGASAAWFVTVQATMTCACASTAACAFCTLG